MAAVQIRRYLFELLLDNLQYKDLQNCAWQQFESSSETQGQIVRERESLNGRKNMARRKEKNGEKSPWGQW